MPGCPRISTHTRRVADPFHVVRVGNRCVDQVRRRVQNETLGHRGRKADPLYRIRKLLLTGSERLDQRGSERMLLGLRVGDPTTNCSAPGWPRNRSATSTSPTHPPTRRRCSTRPSSAASPTRSPRSARSARPSPRGAPRSSPTTTPAPPTVRPKDSTCASRRSSAAATASDPSRTTGYACCSTPAASPGPNGPEPPRIRTRSPHSDA